MRISPETDCAETGPAPVFSACWSPETLLSVTAAPASETSRSPDTDCRVAAPALCPIRTSPETVWSSAFRVMRSKRRSPLTERMRASPSSSGNSTSPDVVSSSTLP